MRAEWAILLGVVACGDASSPAPDSDAAQAAGPIEVTIDTSTAEPQERPAHDPPVDVYIDGVAQERQTTEYPDLAAAMAAPHVIQLRVGTTVLFERRVIDDYSCSDGLPPPETILLNYCHYDSGDVRYGSITVSGHGGSCVGDAFCFSECIFGCPAGRCTSRATSLDPFASHLACAPIGPRQLGETCTWITDPDGAYDDCGDGLACVGGTCRQRCDATSSGCAGCDFVPGFPPEVRVCP